MGQEFLPDQKQYIQSFQQNINESENSIGNDSSADYIPDDSAEWQSFDPLNIPNSLTSTPASYKVTSSPISTSLSLPTPSPDRKYSVPAYPTTDGNHPNHSNVKMRDKTNSVPSRPSSLIEAGGPELKELKVFEIGNLGDHGGRDRENCRNMNDITHAMQQASLSQRHRIDGAPTGLSQFGPSLTVHGGIQNSSNAGERTGVTGDRVNMIPSNSTSTSRGSSQADLLECGASASTSETPKSPLPGKYKNNVGKSFWQNLIRFIKTVIRKLYILFKAQAENSWMFLERLKALTVRQAVQNQVEEVVVVSV